MQPPIQICRHEIIVVHVWIPGVEAMDYAANTAASLKAGGFEYKRLYIHMLQSTDQPIDRKG